MLRVATNQTVILPEADLSDLTPEIRSTLEALTVVERCYETDRECLEGWKGPDVAKLRLLNQLEARHVREREPLVQRLVVCA